jgi:hypothetical protein
MVDGTIATADEIQQFRKNMRELRRHFIEMYGGDSKS